MLPWRDDTHRSDHGYRFGQFRMPQGKWNVYDNDLRIPWVIRGPGIKPATTFDNVASKVDTIPTILGLAGVVAPPTMDGKSIAHLLLTELDEAPAPARELLVKQGTLAPWRTEQLIEYYGLGNVVRCEFDSARPPPRHFITRVAHQLAVEQACFPHYCDGAGLTNVGCLHHRCCPACTLTCQMSTWKTLSTTPSARCV